MNRTDIAKRLNAHLQPHGRAEVAGGGYVRVDYADGCGWRALTPRDADLYLTWLDAGNVGRHWDMEESDG